VGQHSVKEAVKSKGEQYWEPDVGKSLKGEVHPIAGAITVISCDADGCAIDAGDTLKVSFNGPIKLVISHTGDSCLCGIVSALRDRTLAVDL